MDKNILKNRLPKLTGYCYTVDEVYKARREEKLLCLRMDTNYNCNLRCIYCYSDQHGNLDDAFQADIKDIKNYIDQACELGLRSIVYLGGGEPLVYKHFDELVVYMNKKNVIPVIFTNGIKMNSDIAKRLYDLNVSVMIKYDGSERTQDFLTEAGTHKKIRENIDILLKTGFADGDGSVTRLGIAPAACFLNFLEIPEIWRFCRKNNIFPNVERVTAINDKTIYLQLNESHMQILLKRLRDIDETEFNIEWHSPFSAIPAHSCFIYLAGCHITAKGEVSTCPEIKPVGNLHLQSLKEIFSSELFQSIRQLEKNLEEPCFSCEYKLYCLGGCRSKAFQTYGSHFAPDPTCWIAGELLKKNQVNNVDEILIR